MRTENSIERNRPSPMSFIDGITRKKCIRHRQMGSKQANYENNYMRIENTSPDFNKKMINWGRSRLIGHKNIQTMGHVTKKSNREGFSNRIPTEVQAKLQ